MHTNQAHRNNLSASLFCDDAGRRHNERSGGILSRWLRALTRYRKRNKLISSLEDMDDELLRDIRVYRGEIRNVVNGFTDRELGIVPGRSR